MWLTCLDFPNHDVANATHLAVELHIYLKDDTSLAEHLLEYIFN